MTAIQDVIITRTFHASRERVFKAWTDPKQVQQWWGPTHFTNPVCDWNAVPGGTIHIDMTDADGTAYPMGGTFDEIDEPNKIVFTAIAFADKEGTPGIKTRDVVTFEEDGENTKVTITVTVVESLPAFAQALSGMTAGWNQSLDKLTELLQA